MNLIILLNLLNGLAGVLLCVGVYLTFGLGVSMIVAGIYLAYNVITTIRVLNVRDTATKVE